MGGSVLTRPRLVRFAALGAALVALVACSHAPPATVAAPATAPPPRTVVLTGTSGDYAPWSDWNDGAPRGFAPFLFATFASTSAYEPRWTRFAWTSVTDDLRSGRFEIAVDGMTVRPERSLLGRYTIPIASGGAVLLLRRPSWATSTAIADLDKPALRVAVNRGGHLERVTREKLPSTTVTAVPDNSAVRDLLVRREVDAVMTNTFEAPRWAQGLDGIERVGPLTSDITAFWVRADRAELADRLDAWLFAEEESGRLLEARAKWLGEGAGPPAASAVFALLAATAERLALMPWVAAAKQRAGLPIEDLAQEEKVLAAARDGFEKALAARGLPFRPDAAAVERFFRLQMEAAKVVQAKASVPTTSTSSPPTLDDLRLAIARISRRMAFLAARVPPGTNPTWATSTARAVLASSGLDEARVDAIARATAALVPAIPYR